MHQNEYVSLTGMLYPVQPSYVAEIESPWSKLRTKEESVFSCK